MADPVTTTGFHPGSFTRISHPNPTHHRHHHTPVPQMLSPIPLFDTPTPAKGTPSDDDDDDDSDGAKTKKNTTWHRMKWTDDMVRLLIAIVSYVGVDGAPEGAPAAKRPPGAALHKKGKWKAVSQFMLDKGCYVSPQQCEDKFNDLNKRYKRLNEILGRGTTCEVVENPSLLDSMPHVTPKAKEDVRKILSSKHLFYREMCAYHTGPRMASSHDLESHGEDTEDDDELEEEEGEGLGKGGCERLRSEIDAVIKDEARSRVEKMDWLCEREVKLMEERVEMETEGLELKKRRFKWERFRGKKDREMERMRLWNERRILENERTAMQLQKREMEVGLRGNREMMEPVGFRIDREHGREIVELS